MPSGRVGFAPDEVHPGVSPETGAFLARPPARTGACASSPRVTGPLTGAASGIPGCAAPNQPDVSIGCVPMRDATRTPTRTGACALGHRGRQARDMLHAGVLIVRQMADLCPAHSGARGSPPPIAVATLRRTDACTLCSLGGDQAHHFLGQTSSNQPHPVVVPATTTRPPLGRGGAQ